MKILFMDCDDLLAPAWARVYRADDPPIDVNTKPFAREAVPEIVAGYGVTVRGDGRTGGTARAATLAATGQPGALQVRLVDPATKGERPGLGACMADSGAPAFETDQRHAVIGVVSWSTGPQLSAGCGGLTGVTPLARYRTWIVDAAAKMGSVL